jgi:hypothetical protein
MTPRKVDNLKLRFGPYDPPATRRGARLFCEIRGTVVVGGYSDDCLVEHVRSGKLVCVMSEILQGQSSEPMATVRGMDRKELKPEN